MEDREIRAALDLHWAASDANDFEVEHQIYREDAVLEYPQSGERMRGRRHIQASRAAQPNQKRFAVRRILGAADLWISEFVLTYDGQPSYVVSIMEFKDGKVDPRDPILRRCVRAGAVARSMGRADALTERRSTSMASDTLREAKIPLTNGSGAMPALGFGTLIPDPVATREATKAALDVGFRHFDCAERYRNEQAVGEAMQEMFKSGAVARKDVFVTTKLWNSNHRPERVKPAFEASCRRLKLDHVDCYLIHTPFAFQPGDEQEPRDARGQIIYDPGVTLVETWQALERLVDEGRCGAIGLSNVDLAKLQEVVEAARIKPAVVEVESHPYLPEWDMLDYCRRQGIVLLAFAALGHAMEPRLLDDPVITAIARRLGKTPAQVVLAWAVQRGTALLTTSVKPGRIRENFEISSLPEDAMQEIRDRVATKIRFNSVVETGVPGFIPRDR